MLTHAPDGPKGLSALSNGVFDAVLLDVMMPRMDGLEVCRRMRQVSAGPVIMLTAKGVEADRVVGLVLGADDYVAKPFSPRELLARRRAVLRRRQPSAVTNEIVVGQVAVDVGARRVDVAGEGVELAGLEFDLVRAPLRWPLPHYPHCQHHHPMPDRGPWERVHNEAHGRRPGWRRRIQNELHLYYGAHLHRKIFLSFGVVILITVIELAVVHHVFHGTVGQRPWRAFLFFGVPVVLLWSASGRLARRISRPRYELTRVAQKIGAGDLGARAPLPRDATGEIVPLSTSVDAMAARLSGGLARQRELLAAVSHELRTPPSRAISMTRRMRAS